MQLLDGLLALGGDTRNTVPLSRVTAAEVQVLRAIHGPEAVHDVLPLDATVDLKPRDEIERLAEKYSAKDEDGKQIVRVVYAGGPLAVPLAVTDLDLPETCFRVVSRVTAQPVSATAAQVDADLFN
jgi:hypothetical protein